MSRLKRSVCWRPGNSPDAGPELLAFDRLHLALDDVRPLQRRVKLSAVALSVPTLSVARDRTAWRNRLSVSQPGTTKSVAASAGPASATGQNDAEKQTAAAFDQPWRIQVGRVDVNGGSLNHPQFSIGLVIITVILNVIPKALADRPAQQLTAVGIDSLDAKRDAFQRE
ncbi:hypothetical protein [Polaromonas sp. CG_9.11]|uniref:hypothetical protein n=1 Tax=Polaromonas sp. CG_9.11 TaxID=2787730 RepID=UPI0018CA7AFE|nr:hypothetical protein [Polaromonas sp. CG_9.11]MBG6075490.1 hypothetical protein [Polaromonas sp. CG_9.11]